MSCNIVGINRNGAAYVNPSFTSVVDALDTALFGNIEQAFNRLDSEVPIRVNNLTEELLRQSLISGMHASPRNSNGRKYLSVPTDSFLGDKITALNSLNNLFKTNYGLTGDLFTVNKVARYETGKYLGHTLINGKSLELSSANFYNVYINTSLLKPLEDQFSLSAQDTANVINAQQEEQYNRQQAELDQIQSDIAKDNGFDTYQQYLDSLEDGYDNSRLDIGGPVNYNSVKDQILTLQNAFRAAGISVRVELNPDMDSKGRVKAINDNTAVIELNPSKMTDDTHIHEFSHILIDLLGIDNPVVQQAITQLKNTTLAKKVKERYPELSGEKLDKEILVTAIGLAGAKINRNQPNLFQQIFNKIARALRSILGIKEDAVERLAKQLIEGRFDRSNFKGTLSYYAQESKVADYNKESLENIVQQVRISVEDMILSVERSTEDSQTESALNSLKILRKRLENVKSVEDLLSFVNYTNTLVTKAESVFEIISQQFTEGVTEADERMNMINKLFTVGKYLSNLFDGKDNIVSQIQVLTRKEINKTSGIIQSSTTTDVQKDIATKRKEKLDTVAAVLNDALGRVNIVQSEYFNNGIPMIVDLLLEYNTPEINNDLKTIRDNNIKFRRTVGLNRETTEYQDIQEKYKGKLTPEQETERENELIALANAQLGGMEIGRDTLIAELREAQKDKSSFSYWLDPFVYSSQPALQLFGTFVKDNLYKGSDDVRQLIYRIAPAYRKFADAKGGEINPNTFNDKLLEVHTYHLKDAKTGDHRSEQLLTFVQPIDVSKFNNAEREMYRKAAEETGRPKRSDKEAYALWEKDKTKVRKYYDIISKWYSQNTVAAPDAQQRLDKLKTKLARAQKALKDGNLMKDDAKISVASADIEIYNAAIKDIWDEYNKTFRGTAVLPNSKYANAKYEALKADPEAFEYYNTLLEEYKKLQKMINYGNLVRNSWEEFSYMAPPVRSDGLEKIQKDGMFQAAKDFGRDTFTFLETDVAYGDAINANQELRNKIVPIHYHNPINEKLVSRDIGSTIIQFGAMAHMYNRKTQIQGAVIMMADIIERRDVIDTNAANIPIINKLAAKLGYSRSKVKRGVDSNNYKHLKSFIEANFYDEKEIMSQISPFGKTISLNKISSKLASYTAMNNLAANLLQATNQVIIDNIRMQEEAAAAEFFDWKDYFWAKKEYMTTEAASSLQDMGAYAAKSKIVQAAQMFDAFQNIFGENQSGNRTGVKAVKALSLGGMFALQHGAEHESGMTRMLAIFKSYEGKLLDKDGKVLKNDKGEDANVYDIIIDDGTGVFKIREDVYLQDPENNEKVIKFNKMQVINKISAVTKKTNQIKSDVDKVHLQRYAGGRLIMLFRNYFVPSLRRHFGHMGWSGGIYRDLEAGKLSEGTLFTGAKFLRDTYRNGFNAGKTFNQLNDFEKANLNRLKVTMSYYVGAMILGSILMGMQDDDEEMSYADLFALYQAKRLQSELSQFLNPSEFVKLAVSPTAAVRPYQKGVDLIWHTLTQQMPYMLWGDEEGVFYERKSGSHLKGDSKFLAKLEAMFPILNGIEKSKTPEEAVKWFDLPVGSNK